MSLQDPNTGVEVVVTSKSPNIAFAITVAGTGNTRTITIQTDESGFYDFHVWLGNSNTDPSKSIKLPDGGGGNDWTLPTNSSGVLTITVEHSGTWDWYPWAVLIGPAGAGDVLDFT